MDFNTEVDAEQFLMIFGRPFKSLFNLMPLKSGVILLAICDLIIGVYNFIIGIGAVINFVLWSYQYPYFYFDLMSLAINTAGIPFAFLGIRGITKLNLDSLELYYKFEVFELIAESTLGLIEAYFRGVYYDRLLLEIIFALIVIFLSALATKVIWSAVIRLRYNETALVMYGEAAVVVMQQQAVNLANPKVIVPGMPIYFSTPVQGV